MCQNPSLVVCDYVKENGAKHLRFLTSTKWNIKKAEEYYGKKNVYLIPCGKCDDCLIAYKKNWSVRCMAELQYHKDSCFVTLTYDQRHLPFDNKLRKSDLQNFWKRLRKSFPGLEIRYFAAGEYGSQTGRPHYHAIIFGYRPSDLKTFAKNGLGQWFFTSEELDRIWDLGHTNISDVTYDSVKYVAGYTGKKLGQDGFVVMSRKPGIGCQFVFDHADDIVRSGSMVLKDGIVPAPRYALDILEKVGYDVQKLKNDRMDLADAKCRTYLIDHNLEYKDMYAQRDKFTKRFQRKRGL